MEIKETLSIAVTIIGFFLCMFFVIFMLRGSRIPGDKGGHQVIKYKGLELRTNSIITILLISAIVTVLPLSLLFYMERYKSSSIKSTEIIELFLSGQIADESGRGLKGATARIIELDLNGTEREVKTQTVGPDGSFLLPVSLTANKSIKLETDKPGYRKQTVILYIKGVTFPSVLIKEKE